MWAAVNVGIDRIDRILQKSQFYTIYVMRNTHQVNM